MTGFMALKIGDDGIFVAMIRDMEHIGSLYRFYPSHRVEFSRMAVRASKEITKPDDAKDYDREFEQRSPPSGSHWVSFVCIRISLGRL